MRNRLIVSLACCLALACASPSGMRSGASGLTASDPDSASFTIEPMPSITVSADGLTPDELSVGLDGFLYLCDREQARMVRIDRTGQVRTTFSDIDSRAAGAFEPVDVSVAGGIEVYVLDGARSRVLRLDRNLRNATPVYTPETRAASTFGTFRGIALNPVSGDLFITDRHAGAIRRIDMLGGNIHESGGFGSGRASLRGPSGIHCTENGALAVADRDGDVIALQFHFGGELTLVGRGLLDEPEDVVWIDEVHVAVADRNGIAILDTRGMIAGAIELDSPRIRALTFHDGVIYAVDGVSGMVRRFTVSSTIQE